MTAALATGPAIVNFWQKDLQQRRNGDRRGLGAYDASEATDDAKVSLPTGPGPNNPPSSPPPASPTPLLDAAPVAPKFSIPAWAGDDLNRIQKAHDAE